MEKVWKLSQMHQELLSICNMIEKINYGETRLWPKAHFHILNKLLDQMCTTKLARLFMMLLLMDVMLNQWTENQTVNTLK